MKKREPTIFNEVKAALEKANITPNLAEITQIPKVPTDVDVEGGLKVGRLMEALNDHDDVQNVYSSMQMTAQLAAEIEEMYGVKQAS